MGTIGLAVQAMRGSGSGELSREQNIQSFALRGNGHLCYLLSLVVPHLVGTRHIVKQVEHPLIVYLNVRTGDFELKFDARAYCKNDKILFTVNEQRIHFIPSLKS